MKILVKEYQKHFLGFGKIKLYETENIEILNMKDLYRITARKEIITDGGVPFGFPSKLKVDFSESDIPFMVDVIDWAELDDDFRKVILDNSFVIQKNETEN